jgi:hypothetical protein
MPKHTATAHRIFRILLQFTPFIYPPTPFGFGRRQHMILVRKYFPINYFACQNFSTPPRLTKNFRNGSAKGDFVFSDTDDLIGLIGGLLGGG